MRKTFTAFLVMLLVLIQTALAGGSQDNSQETGVEAIEKVTLNMNIIDTDKQDNDARYEYLKEKFNVEFDLVACSLNDVKEKVRIWVASGDMPDVTWTDIKSAGELKTWAKSGALKALPDLSAYPNLAALQAATQSDDVLMVEGNKYFITTARDLASVNFLSNQAFIYRKDWAEELGLYQESYTWEEMMTLAKAMVERDPGNNGAGKTIGMTSVKWAYPACTGIQQISPYWDTFFKKDGKYVWGPEQPETIEAVVMAKRMLEENVIWNEQALAQNADGPAKFSAGQVGILYHNLNTNNVTKIIKGLGDSYPGENVLDKIEIMKVASPDGTYFGLQVPDNWGTICFSAQASDEVVHRYLTMLDFLASDEGVMLQRYGLEGVDYNIDGDKIEMLWDTDGNGNMVSPYAVNSDRILSLVQLNEFEKAFTEYANEDVQVIMEQLRDYMTIENQTIRYRDYEQAAFSAPNFDKSTLGGDTKSKMIELIIRSENIEADYRAWLETQQVKKAAVLQELNNQ